MDSRIKEIEELLNNNIENHPNLVKLWKKYLSIKKHNLEAALSQCERMLENISSFQDQSPEQLLLVCGVLNMVFENTT